MLGGEGSRIDADTRPQTERRFAKRVMQLALH
jgi:hypothetical protein